MTSCALQDPGTDKAWRVGLYNRSSMFVKMHSLGCPLKTMHLNMDAGPSERHASTFIFWVLCIFLFPLRSAQRLGIYSRKIKYIVGGYLPFVETALSAGRQNDGGLCVFLTQNPLIYSFVCGRTWLQPYASSSHRFHPPSSFKSDTF